MIKKVVAVLLAAVLMCISIPADETLPDNPAKVAGYYQSDEADIILLANGTAYSVEESSDKLLDGPYNYSVQFDGDDFIISTGDTYGFFQTQKDKGKTDNGGTYYAVYAEYLGKENEVGFKEGKQIRVGEFIFDNDYDVYERNSLTSFFGSEMGEMASGKMEGDGFDSPEEALTHYIEGLKNNDINQMIEAFAVETFAENYSLTKMVDRIQAYTPTIGYIPNISDFSLQLNIEKRRSDIVNAIRNHYLVLEGSKAVLGENAYTSIPLNDNYDTAQDLVDDLFLSDDAEILDNIEFKNEFIDPAALSENYAAERNQENMKSQIAPYAGEDVASVVAKFYCNGEEVLLMADAVQFNGKWYLNSMGGNIGALLGITAYVYGMVPLQYDEEGYFEELLG